MLSLSDKKVVQAQTLGTGGLHGIVLLVPSVPMAVVVKLCVLACQLFPL